MSGSDTRDKDAERKAKLLKAKKAVEERLRRMDAKDRERQRKDAMRREVVAGREILAEANAKDEQGGWVNPDLRLTVMRLLGRRITNAYDRKLFELPVLETEVAEAREAKSAVKESAGDGNRESEAA